MTIICAIGPSSSGVEALRIHVATEMLRHDPAASGVMRNCVVEFGLSMAASWHRILAGEAGWVNWNEVWRNEPSSRDLAVASKHEAAVVRQDALTMLVPYARYFPPR